MHKILKGCLGLHSTIIRKHLLGLLVGFVLVLQPFAAKAGMSVIIDPGAYAGQWYVDHPGGQWLSGRQTVSLEPGSYAVGVGERTGFLIDVAANGNVTSQNAEAAIGAGNVLTFNTVQVTVDPGAYAGQWVLNHASQWWSGRQTLSLVPGSYAVGVGERGGFLIDVAANGNVTSQNAEAATGAGNVLTLNTTQITIDPGDYTGGWVLIRATTLLSGRQTVKVVSGLSYGLWTTLSNQSFTVARPCAVSPSQLVLDGYSFSIACTGPTADAGPDQAVDEGTQVTLDGSGSSAVEGGTLTYEWTQIAGSSVSLNQSDSVHPTFTAPHVSLGGSTLTFRLVVSEGERRSDPDWVDIQVQNINHSPVSDAGLDQTVQEESPVALDGSNSYDPDADTIAFNWVQTGGPGVSLNDAATAKPQFYAPTVGRAGATLTFQLTVSDGIATATDSVDIRVENVNHQPTANAGPAQTKDEGSLVTLDGTGSSDPDGDAIFYSWSQVAGPLVELSDATAAEPSFIAPLVNVGGATLTFQLTVSDGLLSSNPDAHVNVKIVNVNDPPICNLALPTAATLWPPNHKLAPVGIINVSDPNNDQVSINIKSVTQDEPVNGLGDGDTSPDAVLQGDKVLLRVERAGNGNGRVYRVNFTANDGQGGVCSGFVRVTVPKSMQSGNSPVDDGQLYNSTLP